MDLKQKGSGIQWGMQFGQDDEDLSRWQEQEVI